MLNFGSCSHILVAGPHLDKLFNVDHCYLDVGNHTCVSFLFK